MEFSTKLPGFFWSDVVERLRIEGALFIGFQRKLLLVAGAGGGNGNKEEALKEMADGMKSVQEDFRDSEGWGGWLSKELAPAFGVSGLAHGHRRNKLIGAVPDQLGILRQFTAGLF